MSARHCSLPIKYYQCVYQARQASFTGGATDLFRKSTALFPSIVANKQGGTSLLRGRYVDHLEWSVLSVGREGGNALVYTCHRTV